MFLSTEEINVGHTIVGLVSATSRIMLAADEIDQYQMFDQLIEEAKQKLTKRAELKGGDGLVGVRFNTEIVNVNVAPKFLIVVGYGTVVKLDK
ncbi:heavy metal-binding domain-containing protein [Pediococcus siamensis]|uniref:heavy metal-binding domain-containing protein n=1 Tax=Pediococcus siamensis TaxID=381829 RepID=UPI0039A3B67D